MGSNWAILVAGGLGNRFGGKTPKQFEPLAGKRVIDHSLELFHTCRELAGIVLVLPQDFHGVWRQELKQKGMGDIRLAAGGLTRQRSVANGFGQIAEDAEWVLIHDVARPLVTAPLIRQVLAGARDTGAAVTAVAVADTLKKGDDAHFVQKTVPRDHLYSVQTPQAFSRKLLEEALKWAESHGLDATDEAGIVEAMGHRVRLVEGAVFNFKITRREDLEMAEAYLEKKNGVSSRFRIGEGYDVHAFAEDRDLILGGVKIPFEKGLLGHSDADALCHAIGDALLGAMAEGDLGKHFPDTDPKYKGISSLKILAELAEMVQNKGLKIGNIDATIVCQRPKLAPHIPEMRKNIAAVLGIALDQISVKATTEEGLGFTGSMAGLAARALALLENK